MVSIVEGKRFMGFCNRLLFVLILVLVFSGIHCQWDTTWASSFESRRDAANLEVDVAGQELIQTARLDQSQC